MSVFERLAGSSTGAEIEKELDAIKAEICDCRNWKEGMTKEAALSAVNAIDDLIISRLHKRQGNTRETLL